MSKSMKKWIPLVLFANLAALAAGCAKGNLPTQFATERGGAQLPTVMANGKEYKLGWDEKRFKQVDKKVKKNKLKRQGLLPTKVDNAQFCTPVADQSRLGACTAFAVGKGFREYYMIKDNEPKADLSALFLYYEARRRWGSTATDSGSTITDSIAVLENTGIATEQSWPYDILKFTNEPPADAYASAKQYKYQNAIRISGLDDAQVAMAKGEAVLFAFDVMESFKVGSDGLMPVPRPGEKRRGGHAVLAVGYDSQKQLVKVRNSWGANWGDKGYFYMPYKVFQSNARDIWTADFRR